MAGQFGQFKQIGIADFLENSGLIVAVSGQQLRTYGKPLVGLLVIMPGLEAACQAKQGGVLMATTLTQACIASSSVLAHCGVSYALGPVDESFVVQVAMRSEGGFEFVLLVPGSGALSEGVLNHPDFHEGATWGYSCGFDELSYTPVQMANLVANDFYRSLHCGGSYAWVVGCTLGLLSSIAEVDRLIALVGIAHLCFLLSLVPDVAAPALYRVLNDAFCAHGVVLRSYRVRVQALKKQGVSIVEAWRLALCA